MTSYRPAAVAGRFYPDNARELNAMIKRFLVDAESSIGESDCNPGATDSRSLRAIIAPHAGYIYSGEVAASAYARLTPVRKSIKRVVLVGPAHHVRVDGLAISRVGLFRTPLGDVPLDQNILDELERLPQVNVNEEAHAPEHSLEVHLPFLQSLLGEFRLVPILVGRSSPEEVCDVLSHLWNLPDTLIVISSDLSHFHSYDEARRIDTETCRLIESRQEEQLHGKQACGYLGIAGLLQIARENKLHVHLMDFRNSGDTSGDRDRVVGYASFVVTEPKGDTSKTPTAIPRFDAESRRILLDVAAFAINHELQNQRTSSVDIAAFPKHLQVERASFVTLRTDGKLRGCMGTLSSIQPLVADVAANAHAAAFRDPRFPPLNADEFSRLWIQVSVLSPATPIDFEDERDLLNRIRPGRDGLILRFGNRRGTLLPSVWENIPNRQDFLRALKQKAGLEEAFWSEEIQLDRYTTESFSTE